MSAYLIVHVSPKNPEKLQEYIGQVGPMAGKAGAEVLVGADLGCLLSLEGRLQKDGSKITVKHIAEVLVEGGDDEN